MDWSKIVFSGDLHCCSILALLKAQKAFALEPKRG